MEELLSQINNSIQFGFGLVVGLLVVIIFSQCMNRNSWGGTKCLM